MRRLALLLLLLPGAAPSAPPPNVIFLLADDLGWPGLGSTGSDFHETPNLDRLAAEGMKFTDAYAACTVCSPSRAAVLTGKYPARLHLTDWIPGQNRPHEKLKIPEWTKRLERGEVTIADALRKAGYKTAHVGKWHLGSKGHLPEDQGFDVNVAGTPVGSPPGGYFLPNRLDLPRAPKGGYLTDHLTDEALRLIRGWKDKPFFLYFSYYTVHTPIQGRKDLVARYERKLKPGLRHSNPKYAAMHHSLDESAGRIMKALDELGIADRTAVFFTSDNGGLSHKYGKPTGITDNGPLRRGKGSAYEGGHRVPLIVRWPGVTPPGSVCREPVSGVDYFPTIMELAGVASRAVDGRSLFSLLRDPAARLDREAIYWHYPHYHAGGDSPYGAIRAGDWKLVEFYEEGNVELYNLAKDEGEKKDLSNVATEKAAELLEKLRAWRTSIGAQMPSANPDHDPKRAGRGRRR